ncbi:potassium transporter TrkG [Albimonas sp. CAU 1670]|uniref:potassium transporter TrkG n=1 Tax=Albimonas sp. CAU 1670 TaxID=3032599 RepID=UPI0023D9A46A|nr:potassium transporter TrkG [Albimonas sp. CAU 1670]MDF2233101.1 potassium transporter TrkG [Albimonas sp. CAU 1670]
MRLRGFPVFLVFAFALGAMMLLPALAAGLERDWRSARLFFYAALFVMLAASALGAAAWRRGASGANARAELMTLLGVFAAGPVFAAAPIALILPELGWTGAYFEATSSLTTTGATLITPFSAPPSIHLWRSMLGWVGGLATLVGAVSILAPRELLDLPGASSAGEARMRVGRILALGPGGRRAMRALMAIGPAYAALTAIAAAALATAGTPSFVALCHAMGIVSTSGISPLAGGLAAQGNRMAEVVAVLFLILSISRLTFGRRGPTAGPGAARNWLEARRDPEIQLFLIAVAVATAWLFAHGVWVGAGPSQIFDNPFHAGRALWGGFATSVGMISTSGYVSADWPDVVTWAQVEAPSLMLMGLATLGGGVATTAGGVKLFRAYALYRHGGGELDRLCHPSRVDTARTSGGRLSRDAIVNAWVYVMLYMTALAVALMALTLAGMDFDAAMAGAVASLSNTGPLFPLATGHDYQQASEGARAVMMAAMILGRIEVLAAVALCNPAYWRS